MAPASNNPMFGKDERVLCFHHDLLYEAKILDSQLTDPKDKKSPWEYKIHYKGWKNTWDDWVPADRLRKLNDENRELAKNLKNEMDAVRARMYPKGGSKKKGAESSIRGSEERSITAGPRGVKRGRDFDIEPEEKFQSRPTVKVFMHDRLKSLLVDDWEYITKNLQLVTLPSHMPASIILDEYAEQEKQKRHEGSAEWEILEEVIAGCKEYFNRCLGRILLYRFERQQFLEIYKQIEEPTGSIVGKSLAEVYGGEHLLRLFVSMPELIAQTNMDSQSVGRLREELSKITQWLSKEANISRYFLMQYENATQEYQEIAKGWQGGPLKESPS